MLLATASKGAIFIREEGGLVIDHRPYATYYWSIPVEDFLGIPEGLLVLRSGHTKTRGFRLVKDTPGNLLDS